ncbi:unnamed protein product [Pleuronectes platessa]|uniref:Uncharacterized protein n=1 Tax=Pleuronectes platessa TaxID=8262 RepID=A0A9N7Z426_PLEPL|nr:unnamed protein product [Pleuronectes platessa]
MKPNYPGASAAILEFGGQKKSGGGGMELQRDKQIIPAAGLRGTEQQKPARPSLRQNRRRARSGVAGGFPGAVSGPDPGKVWELIQKKGARIEGSCRRPSDIAPTRGVFLQPDIGHFGITQLALAFCV